MKNLILRIPIERKLFSQLVLVAFFRSLILSITGTIDVAIAGNAIGTDGLSAMGLAAPIFSIISLFSNILGSGQTVAISRQISLNNKKKADQIITSTLILCFIISLIGLLSGIFCPQFIARILADEDFNPLVYQYTTQYLRIILIFTLPIIMYSVLSGVMLLEGAEGALRLSNILILVGDVFFVLLFTKLNYGINGIALSSGLAYTLACLPLGHFFLSGKTMFSIDLSNFEIHTLPDVFSFGLPRGISTLCRVLFSTSINRFMVLFGTNAALAALSLQDALHYVPQALCSGISEATLILTGIYASENDDKALSYQRISIGIWSLLITSFFSAILYLISPGILRYFTADMEVYKLGILALRYYLYGVPFMAINLAITSLLQGRGSYRHAYIFVIINRLILPVSLAFLLGKNYRHEGIYLSFALSEIITAVLALLLFTLFKLRRNRSGNNEFKEDPEIRVDIHSLDEATKASKLIYDFCLINSIAPNKAYSISLCAEELATNVIEHGFKDGKKHHEQLRALIHDDVFIMRLRDDCRRFDIVSRYKMINPENIEKNIGLRIIFAKADEVIYSSSLNMNNVCIRIKDIY